MHKTHLYVFSEDIDRKKLTDFLDSRRDAVSFWFYSMANTIFIQSNLTAQEISELIESRFGVFVHYIVELRGDNYGRLPKDHWQYLK